MNRPTDHEPATEPEKTPEAIDPEANTAVDNPEPQGTDTLAEPVEDNPTNQSADPLSPTVDPPSLAKASDKPSSPAKTTDDDVVVTGLGFSSPGHPVALSSIAPKKKFLLWTKGNGNPSYPTIPTSALKTFILVF